MYKDICEFKNILDCQQDTKIGTSWKASVQMNQIRTLRNVDVAKQELISLKPKARHIDEFYLNCRGKTRYIQAFGIQDRTNHKAITRYSLKPAVASHIFYDNSATMDGRGNDFAIRRLVCHLERHYRKYKKEGGVLLIDFHDYFNSIDREKLYSALGSIIDEETLYLHRFYTSRFLRGIGVGSELCQVSAVYYPTPYDHNAKHNLHIKGYHRYMDDSIFINESLKKLEYCLESQTEVANELGIELNKKHTQIIPFTKSFIFMKKEFYVEDNGHITIRIQNKYRKKHHRKIKAQREALNEHPERFESILNSNQSWFHYSLKYDTHENVLRTTYLFYKTFSNEIDEHLLTRTPSKIKKNKFLKELLRLSAKYSGREDIKRLRENVKELIRIDTERKEKLKQNKDKNSLHLIEYSV